jgi:hypothetical protein
MNTLNNQSVSDRPEVGLRKWLGSCVGFFEVNSANDEQKICKFCTGQRLELQRIISSWG